MFQFVFQFTRICPDACWAARHAKVYTLLTLPVSSEHLVGPSHPDTFITTAPLHCSASYSWWCSGVWLNKSWSWQGWEERAGHQNMSHIRVIIPIVHLLIILAVDAPAIDPGFLSSVELTLEKSAPMEMIM